MESLVRQDDMHDARANSCKGTHEIATNARDTLERRQVNTAVKVFRQNFVDVLNDDEVEEKMVAVRRVIGKDRGL